MINLMLGDCLERMKEIPDNSIDSIVTDPPYGLSAAKNSGKKSTGGFMGKKWDYDVPSVEIWQECLRVLKPGGHLLAFAGTRTQHRMACRIEDAGFEIRDMMTHLYDTNDAANDFMQTLSPEQHKLMARAFSTDGMIGWGYGSGFPKSLDVSKAIDKMAGAERKVIGERQKSGIGGSSTYAQDVWTQANRGSIKLNVTSPATDEARQWSGFGTALKPALEPLTWAQKPFKTVPYNDIINIYNIIGLIAWELLSNVNRAELISWLNCQDQKEEYASVQIIAGILSILKKQDQLEKMGMFKLQEEEKTILSIGMLWKDILIENYSNQSMFTTSTILNMTTVLRTLKLCLLPIMQKSITKERYKVFGVQLVANNVASSSSEEQTNYQKKISAQEVAMLLMEPNTVRPVDQNFIIAANIVNSVLLNAITHQEKKHNVALEPITVARKPLSEKTVAANVLKHGVGGINIDGCRVGNEDMSAQWDRSWNDNNGEFGNRYSQSSRESGKNVQPGRFPANLLHDGSEEVLALFPESSVTGKRSSQSKEKFSKESPMVGTGKTNNKGTEYTDQGSAARFFYCAKTSKKDRGEGNNHPTVKPTELMRYLCRLATPPGGTVLDPFTGSGSTGKAAMAEGFKFIGIELDEHYFNIAKARIESDIH